MEKKHSRFYERRINYNRHNHQNFLRTEDSKNKTTESISGWYQYRKTCWWNLWRGVSERLCSLEKIDQRVIQQQKFYGPLEGNKIT